MDKAEVILHVPDGYFVMERLMETGKIRQQRILYMGREQNLSKFISLVLRHKPQAAGIELDSHGWADVNGLIDGICKTGRSIDRDLLEKIVHTDEKQRYRFNSDGTKIRASQGHSIPADVELQEAEPPEYLYHGTSEKAAAHIILEGVKPMGRLYVHLSKDTKTAQKVGKRHGKPVVFRVSAGRMYQSGISFFISENGVWLCGHVPAKFLERVIS